MLQDILHALKGLTARPGFAISILSCAALGIGLCAAMFSVVHAMLLRPFPFAEPQGIVAVVAVNHEQNLSRAPLSYDELTELQRGDVGFAATAGYTTTTLTFSTGSDAQQLEGATVSADLFTLLGVEPILGRPFLPEDHRPGAPGTALIGHGLWQRELGADDEVAGRWVRIDGVPHQVVGVMPPRFGFPFQQQLWVPMAPRMDDRPRDARAVEVLARLSPETPLERVRAETAALAERLAEQAPDEKAGWTWRTMPLHDFYVWPGMRIMALTMMGAAVFILLIACANVANLLLSRAVGRHREIAMRTVLGASPSRILRQLLTESMLLAVAAGALGIGLAMLAVRALSSLLAGAPNVPFWLDLTVDLPVLAFTVATAVATGVLFGLAPALQAARAELSGLLQARTAAGGGGRASGRLRSGLVVSAIGLSAVLLIGGALFVRSFLKLQQVDAGIDEQRLLTVRVHLPGERYEEPAARLRWARSVLGRLQTVPGVTAAYTSPFVPLAGGMNTGTVEVAGGEQAQRPVTYWAPVSPDVFATLGVSVASGRDFTENESWEGRPVAVVDRRFVERFFPSGEAIGRRFRLTDAGEAPWVTVVGISESFKVARLDEPGSPVAFVPYAFAPGRDVGLVVRTSGDPYQVLDPLRQEVSAVDPEVPVAEVASMTEIREAATWQLQIVSRIFAVFGALALLLAGIGLYGVISHMVGQRRAEIGVRVALGAQRRQVLALIMRQGLRLAVIGVGIGGIAAFLLSRLLASFLYGIGAADPVSFVGLTVFLLLVAALASYLPAVRATRLDPTDALRAE
jgi:putative ABC transport system permease protein